MRRRSAARAEEASVRGSIGPPAAFAAEGPPPPLHMQCRTRRHPTAGRVGWHWGREGPRRTRLVGLDDHASLRAVVMPVSPAVWSLRADPNHKLILVVPSANRAE